MRKIILKGGELGRERGKGEEEFEEATKKESTRKWRKERQSRRLQQLERFKKIIQKQTHILTIVIDLTLHQTTQVPTLHQTTFTARELQKVIHISCM